MSAVCIVSRRRSRRKCKPQRSCGARRTEEPIHPFVLNEDGTSKQADLEGGWYEFEKDYFGSVFFEGKTIPCISLKGQKVFHSGYELRDKDKHDISILESLSK